MDDFIRLAQETHEIKYVLFYLHENERYFNDRINTFLTSETDWFSPERFMDLKLECRIEVLKRLSHSRMLFILAYYLCLMHSHAAGRQQHCLSCSYLSLDDDFTPVVKHSYHSSIHSTTTISFSAT